MLKWTTIRTGPRKISNLQLAGEHKAVEGGSLRSVPKISVLHSKRWYRLVVCSSPNCHGTFLQAASGKTYLCLGNF